MSRKKNGSKKQDDIDDAPSRYASMFKLKKETLDGIWAIILIVVAIFLFLASIGSGGVLGTNAYQGLTYLFGIGYYLIPLLFTMLAVSFLRALHHNFALPKVLGAIIFFGAGLSMVHLLLPERGGVVGGFIAKPVINLVDIHATFLFLLAFLIISFLIMFDAALDFQFIKRLFAKKEIEEGEEDESIIINPITSIEPVEKSIVTNPPVELKKDTEAKVDPNFSYFFRSKKAHSFVPPPLDLLEGDRGKPGVGDIKANANLIKRTLQNFGIPVEMDEITIGPTVTRYALKPAEGVKLSRIQGLQDNLALALAAQSIRIEAPIPGKSLVGIEIPNTSKTTVGLGGLLSTTEFQDSDKPLTVALGKTVSGSPSYANLAKMPHLLIAGTTGAGKSVAVHALLTSLLYRNSPEMLKFIMVDAKRVELTLYNKIPHLLTPVITEAKKTIMALRWAAKEMDRRYDILEKESVRDITSYHKNIVNKELSKNKDSDEIMIDPMPYIVIVIDELADLMQAYPRELEGAIVRLAQMSRAVGIHLIISTQRPSVNVITGLIKANVPTRIALKVGSQIDSRTILDRAGAEKLIGQGDMLFMSQDNPDPIRIQSPYISEEEVKQVVKYFVDTYKDEAPPMDINLIKTEDSPDRGAAFGSMTDAMERDEASEDDDELYEQAKVLVIEAKRASTSYIQRKLRVGYARAARLMDMLEERGVIAPGDGSSKPREVLDSSNSNPGSNA